MENDKSFDEMLSEIGGSELARIINLCRQGMAQPNLPASGEDLSPNKNGGGGLGFPDDPKVNTKAKGRSA